MTGPISASVSIRFPQTGLLYLDDATPDNGSGTADDRLLGGALAQVAADTNQRTIVIGRSATFTRTQTPFSGMKILGLPYEIGTWNGELSSMKFLPIVLRVNMAGGTWFPYTGTVYNTQIANMPIYSSDNNTTLYTSSGNAYACSWGGHALYGVKNVFGSQTSRFANTGINVYGSWVHSSLPVGGCFLNGGGSDSDYFVRGSLNLDCIGTGSTGYYAIILNSQSKTNLYNVFLTARPGWSGVNVTGTCSVRIHGMRIEGHDAGGGANNCTLLNYSGNNGASTLSVSQTRIAFGTNNVITHSGGDLALDMVEYERASNVAETVPFLVTSGGSAYVSKTLRAAGQGPTWTGVPRTRAAGGTIVNADASTVAA